MQGPPVDLARRSSNRVMPAPGSLRRFSYAPARASFKFAPPEADDNEPEHVEANRVKKWREQLEERTTIFRKALFLVGYGYDKVLPPYSRARAKYKLDTWMAKRAYQMGMLVIGTAIWILVSGFFFSMVNSDQDPGQEGLLSEALWKSWTFMADPGVHAEIGNSCKESINPHDPALFSCIWPMRLFSLVITWGGILAFAIVLGFVVDIIREKMDSLKKGKTKVVETGHTLILGWTDKTVQIIKEIALANSSEAGGTIVLMGTQEKELLDAEVREQIKRSDLVIEGARTKIVTRSGSPMFSGDLLKVSALTARVIIVLSDDQVPPDRADAQTLRTVLTIMGLRDDFPCQVIAEVRDVDNEQLVKLVGGAQVETVVSHDIMGRLMLMSARQPGLAKVYESILGFDGDEFYSSEWPELIGHTFGEFQLRFPDAIPIGIKDKRGKIILNPPSMYKLGRGEEVIVIAEDDDTYAPNTEPVVLEPNVSTPLTASRRPIPPEKILFCGWRRDIRDVLVLLDAMVEPGSELHMLCEVKLHERAPLLADSGMDVNDLRNLTIIHHYGNTAVRRRLEKLPVEEFTSVMIMSDELTEADPMHSDSHTLATLLLLRDIQKSRAVGRVRNVFGGNKIVERMMARRTDGKKCPCVCEILDARTQRTILSNRSISLESDFVQSNTLISRILAMVSEDRNVHAILDELLGVSGCGFSVVQSEIFVSAGDIASFNTVSMRARAQAQILVGYQRRRSIGNTVVNPRDKTIVQGWDDFDFVLLEGESAELLNSGALQEIVAIFKKEGRKRTKRLETIFSSPKETDELVVEDEDGVEGLEQEEKGRNDEELEVKVTGKNEEEDREEEDNSYNRSSSKSVSLLTDTSDLDMLAQYVDNITDEHGEEIAARLAKMTSVPSNIHQHEHTSLLAHHRRHNSVSKTQFNHDHKHRSSIANAASGELESMLEWAAKTSRTELHKMDSKVLFENCMKSLLILLERSNDAQHRGFR